MTLAFTDFQVEFRDTIRRFFSDQIGSDRVRRVIGGTEQSSTIWTECQSLGLLEGFSDSAGGFGYREAGILAYECGRALVPAPLVESVVACALVPRLAGLNISEGEHVGTFAFAKDTSFTVKPGTEGKSLLTGILPVVPYGEFARQVLIRQRHNDKNRYFLVALGGATTAKRNPVTTLDKSMPVFSVELKCAEARILPEVAALIVDSLLDCMASNIIAGASARTIEMASEHVTTREQFGVPVGGFQAVQHALATCLMQSESLTALAEFSAWALDNSPQQAALSTASAFSYAMEVGSAVVESTLQVHGGIGFTWEHDLHFFLRRIKFWECLAAPRENVDSRVIAEALAVIERNAAA